MFDNKWRGEKIAWQLHSVFPWSNLADFSAGIAPIPVALDPRVGTEVALFIVDYTEFAHDIARLEPFQSAHQVWARSMLRWPGVVFAFLVTRSKGTSRFLCDIRMYGQSSRSKHDAALLGSG